MYKHNIIGAEAILPATGGMCNLSEVIVRSGDGLEELKHKVKWAIIFGTLQSTLTNFRYLRKIWKKNAEEERLLGASLTGIADHEVMSGLYFRGDGGVVQWLQVIKDVAQQTNIEWANKLGINTSKQLTLVKPSGTVSLLANSSSGIHPRYAEYYIRRVTQDVKDPLTNLMKDEGVPFIESGDKVIFSFLVKSPEGAALQKNISALEQLELWSVYYDYWCEGNPSQTIYYTDKEFLGVCAWVYEHWDKIGGLSFFPVSDHIYKNAPLEEISKQEYEELMKVYPLNIRWDRLPEFEKEDETTSSQTFACTGGGCDL